MQVGKKQIEKPCVRLPLSPLLKSHTEEIKSTVEGNEKSLGKLLIAVEMGW